jgi:hypothetical protein
VARGDQTLQECLLDDIGFQKAYGYLNDPEHPGAKKKTKKHDAQMHNPPPL